MREDRRRGACGSHPPISSGHSLSSSNPAELGQGALRARPDVTPPLALFFHTVSRDASWPRRWHRLLRRSFSNFVVQPLCRCVKGRV
jgi:hypothetical protein